jgi:histidinol-phosphate aminotransferase
VTSAEELGAIAALGVPVVFDCAYSEFAQDQSVYRKALEIPSVIRVGSFSKAWGLAGLRVGWAAASRDLAQAIRDAAPPFATAGTSIRAAMYALENGEAAMERNVARTRLERARLAALLASLGAHTWKAEANFVPAEVRDPAGLLSFLSGRGIRVRAWPGRSGYEKLVRITCPADRDEFGALAKALREAKEYL